MPLIFYLGGMGQFQQFSRLTFDSVFRDHPCCAVLEIEPRLAAYKTSALTPACMSVFLHFSQVSETHLFPVVVMAVGIVVLNNRGP